LINNLKSALLIFLILFLFSSCDLLNDNTDNTDISGKWSFTNGEYYSELITSSNQVAINPASKNNGCIYVSGAINTELTYFDIMDYGSITELTASNLSLFPYIIFKQRLPSIKYPYIEYTICFEYGEYKKTFLSIFYSNNYDSYYPSSIEFDFDEDMQSFTNIYALFWKKDPSTSELDSNTVITISGSVQFQKINIQANESTKIEHDASFESIKECEFKFNENGDYYFHITLLDSVVIDLSYGQWYTIDNYLITINETFDTTKFIFDLDGNELILTRIESCPDYIDLMEDYYRIDSGSLISFNKVNKLYFSR